MPQPAINRSRILRWQRVRTKRSKLWSAMRMMRRFTVSELLAVCEMDTRQTVQAFIHELKRAGYVRCIHRGNEALHEPATFLLIRNTGPLCPAAILRRQSMWDPNTDKEYPFEH